MTVEIVEGDLLDQEVDAIVNAWNRNFIPWWLLLPRGVSGAIKRRAGVEPFRELSRRGMMRAGDAFATGAGRLPHKAIIHVAALEWYWVSSLKIIERCTANALRLARERGFATLAFPAIGAGTGGVGVKRSIETIRGVCEREGDGIGARIVRFGGKG